MNLVGKSSGNMNIIARPQALPTFYPEATETPVRVALWMGEVGRPRSEGVLIGEFAPGDKVTVPFNPQTDRNVEFWTISFSASGTPDVSSHEDALGMTALFQRDAGVPVIGQNGEATAEKISIGVVGFTRFARMRRIRIADNAEMDNPSIIIRDSDSFVERELPPYFDLYRSAQFAPDFAWNGSDPTLNGFTKVGNAPTSVSGEGWRINSTGTDGETYYGKIDFPANPFINGFTLEITPPVFNSSDATETTDSVMLGIDDGTHRYNLSFSATEVRFNGTAGVDYTHANQRIRLVVAIGGATADLWIGDTLVADNIAYIASSATGFIFGDRTTTEDSDAVWQTFSYALTVQPPTLAQTIYVAVAHSSGGAWGAESAVGEFSFASEVGEADGTSGTFDPTPRDAVIL